MNREFREILEDNLDRIEKQVAEATERSCFAAKNVRILAVSKTQAVERMRPFRDIISARGGQPIFGENYVQELHEKKEEFPDCRFHLIGRLQKNKVRKAVALADVIESVDSLDLADLINAEASRLGKRQDVFLQTNIAEDPAKAGFRPDQLADFILTSLSRMTALRVLGLMTIVFLYDEPEAARKDYRKLRLLRDDVLMLPLAREILETDSLELSMGMSDDFVIAVEEGATEVRIGTALFGARNQI